MKEKKEKKGRVRKEIGAEVSPVVLLSPVPTTLVARANSVTSAECHTAIAARRLP